MEDLTRNGIPVWQDKGQQWRQEESKTGSDRGEERVSSEHLYALSREHTCVTYHAEGTDVWRTAQVWTCAQVVRCGTICLSAVHNPIHRLSVHQSKAVLHIAGSERNLPQPAKQYVHRASHRSSFGASLFLALQSTWSRWHLPCMLTKRTWYHNQVPGRGIQRLIRNGSHTYTMERCKSGSHTQTG